jgi:hypothetical protein
MKFDHCGYQLRMWKQKMPPPPPGPRRSLRQWLFDLLLA